MQQFLVFLALLSACDVAPSDVPWLDDDIEPGEAPRDLDVDATDAYPGAVTDVLDLSWPPYAYGEALPAAFDSVARLDNTPDDNPVTSSGATLGRVLFYDTELSANRSVACASCHDQAAAFTDPVVFSEGFEGGLTGRNSMSLINVRFYDNGRAFWDERAQTFEDQVLQPIQDPVEMGLSLPDLMSRVASSAYYPRLIEDAFGDATVTSERISLALAQFVRSIVSYRSDFDVELALAGDIDDSFAGFTAQENRGKDLFLQGRGNCATCHLDGGGRGGGGANEVVFLIGDARNNGLDAQTTDAGAGGGRFKSPSLRNVALTGPYMHDGRFDTLEDVVEFYDSGIQDHPNLHRTLTNNGQPRRLNLSDADKAALVAFLHTLTDHELLADPRFSDPFH